VLDSDDDVQNLYLFAELAKQKLIKLVMTSNNEDL